VVLVDNISSPNGNHNAGTSPSATTATSMSASAMAGKTTMAVVALVATTPRATNTRCLARFYASPVMATSPPITPSPTATRTCGAVLMTA
ncbi:hypothetical protein HC891_19490, partial [Candidatus Gracilibacteria bacterium]|nr:hypothetical protein [Candidatus Gracilibacteria bacterium]